MSKFDKSCLNLQSCDNICRSNNEDACVCFKFLDSCEFESLRHNQDKIFGVAIYDCPGMQYYPFWGMFHHKTAFIPMGACMSMTVLGKGVYRMVSSRTYSADSLIYFDNNLTVLAHFYLHKSGFKMNDNIRNIENAVIKLVEMRSSSSSSPKILAKISEYTDFLTKNQQYCLWNKNPSQKTFLKIMSQK